jgi:hypothetical protein
MKLGILSDTHNHLPATRRALETLLAAGATEIVHCGDIGPDALRLLSRQCERAGIRAHVAIGNCDARWTGDLPYLPAPPNVDLSRFPSFEADGKRCAACHGHQAWILENALLSGEYAYLFTGHTHRPADERTGPTRLINPGSAAEPRTDAGPTAAILDPATDTLSLLPL